MSLQVQEFFQAEMSEDGGDDDDDDYSDAESRLVVNEDINVIYLMLTHCLTVLHKNVH